MNTIISFILLMLLILVAKEIIQTYRFKSNVWRKVDTTLFFTLFYTFLCHISSVYDIKSWIMIGFPELEIIIYSIVALARIVYLEYKKSKYDIKH